MVFRHSFYMLLATLYVWLKLIGLKLDLILILQDGDFLLLIDEHFLNAKNDLRIFFNKVEARTQGHLCMQLLAYYDQNWLYRSWFYTEGCCK